MKSQPHDAPVALERNRWWREARVGMFIHFGLYAIPGRGEWVMHDERVPIREYERLARLFRPAKSAPRTWARLAREMGARYVVLTTKHHDGFCLFDTRLTRYNSMNTPARRDIVRDYVEALRAEGLRVGLYYSVEDWHHPDWPMQTTHRLYGVERPRRPPREPEYFRYMLGQLEELLTNYGAVDIVWFDRPYEGLDGDRMLRQMRRWQPNIVVNDRGGSTAPRHDFVTPEQWVPDKPMRAGGKEILWETCNTLTGGAWGYDRFDRNWRSSEDLVRMIVTAAGGGGNFILNIGPRSDGSVPREVAKRLCDVGAWLRRAGAAVCGTQAGLVCAMPYGRSTRRANSVFLHVLDWPASGRLAAPPLAGRPVRAQSLTGRRYPVRGGVVIVPRRKPDALSSVVELVYPSAEDLAARERAMSPPTRKPAASSVEYVALRGAPTVIDGTIDPAIWGHIPPVRVTQETHYDWGRDRYPVQASKGWCAFTMRWMHAGDVLYGEIEVESADPVSGPFIWSSDGVEFYFGADLQDEALRNNRESFHILMDVGNRVMVERENQVRGLIFRHALRRTDKGYNVVIALPFASLLRKAGDPASHVRPEDVICVNVAVNQAAHTIWDDPARQKRLRDKPWWIRGPLPANAGRVLAHRVHWKGTTLANGKHLWGRMKLAEGRDVRDSAGIPAGKRKRG